MPTYEFRCPDGHVFDRFYRKMSDAVSELPCPQCGKVAARQLSAGAGLLFKGSGFYLTDYGKNAHRESGGARSNGAARPDGEKKSGTGGGDAAGGTTSGSAESGSGSASGTKASPPSGGSASTGSGTKSES